ncbi:hypothetical protein N7523_011109 [Penicillium sp. IBT 18751x]|nr:hypothetical protein N7523_011109 [Penicillium sp. IBT 18751x]
MGTFYLDDQPSTFMMDGTCNPSWENIAIPSLDNEPPIATVTEWSPVSPFSVRKRLLKLTLELIDDLELLESGPFIIGTSSILRGDVSPTVGTLDLPIFRMLSHSTQFVDILETSSGAAEDIFSSSSHLNSSREAFGINRDTKSPSTDHMGGSVEDGERTTSSYDSAYLTSMEPSPEQAKSLESQGWDISTALSMLATYCHLIRMYRAVFTQLYQLFLIIPPADAAAYLLLPNLKFGQFHMEGNLTVQARVLIELGSSMLLKIERGLGMSQGNTQERDGELSTMAYILDDSPLVYIRDHITAQEKLTHAIPLKETMNCLRQLLKDPANT